jgi:hypothetical protein
VFAALKWESGFHRVQRVLVTEVQRGASTPRPPPIAVLTEAEEVDIPGHASEHIHIDINAGIERGRPSTLIPRILLFVYYAICPPVSFVLITEKL